MRPPSADDMRIIALDTLDDQVLGATTGRGFSLVLKTSGMFLVGTDNITPIPTPATLDNPIMLLRKYRITLADGSVYEYSRRATSLWIQCNPLPREYSPNISYDYQLAYSHPSFDTIASIKGTEITLFAITGQFAGLDMDVNTTVAHSNLHFVELCSSYLVSDDGEVFDVHQQQIVAQVALATNYKKQPHA